MIFKKLSLFMIFGSLLLMVPLYPVEKQRARTNSTKAWLTGRNIGWTALALGAVATAGGWVYKKWLDFNKQLQEQDYEQENTTPLTSITSLEENEREVAFENNRKFFLSRHNDYFRDIYRVKLIDKEMDYNYFELTHHETLKIEQKFKMNETKINEDINHAKRESFDKINNNAKILKLFNLTFTMNLVPQIRAIIEKYKLDQYLNNFTRIQKKEFYDKQLHDKMLNTYAKNYETALKKALSLNAFDPKQQTFEYENICEFINQLLRYYKPIHTLKKITTNKN